MRLKIATFNLENLFTRPSAMRDGGGENGQEAIDDHARLNAIIIKAQYSQQDKVTLAELAQKYGFHRLNLPVDAFIYLKKIRAGLFLTKNGALVVSAKSRSDWTGWFELRRDDVIWEVTLNTAKVIAEVDADILVCIEAENRVVLQRFNQVVLMPQFNGSIPHVMLIDENDRRGIDLGVKSHYPITSHIGNLMHVAKRFSAAIALFTQLTLTTESPSPYLPIISKVNAVVITRRLKRDADPRLQGKVKLHKPH